jgi:hypothetical protein
VLHDPGPIAVPTVPGPDPEPHPDPIPTPRGPLPDAEAVIHAQLAPAVHACYERGLSANPGEHGTVTVFLQVGANGEVSSATVSGSGIDANTVSCIRYAAGRAHFRPSTAGGAVSAPFSLVRQ